MIICCKILFQWWNYLSNPVFKIISKTFGCLSCKHFLFSIALFKDLTLNVLSLIEDNSLDPNSLEQTRTRVDTFGPQDHRKHNPGLLFNFKICILYVPIHFVYNNWRTLKTILCKNFPIKHFLILTHLILVTSKKQVLSH